MTSAPFAVSSLTIRDIAFSLPGIGLELRMMTSSSVMVTFLCVEAAIRDSAAMLSP